MEVAPHYYAASTYGWLRFDEFLIQMQRGEPDPELLEEALWALRIAYERNHYDQSTLVTFGVVLDQLGHFEEATAVHNRSVEMGWRRENKYGAMAAMSMHLYYRGESVWMRRKSAQALGYYQRSLEYLEASRARNFKINNYEAQKGILEERITCCRPQALSRKFPVTFRLRRRISNTTQMAQGRKEALSVQALQFVDAVLVLLAFLGADLVKSHVKSFLIDIGIPLAAGTGGEGRGLEALMPLLYVIIPLTPIALEWFGFYRHPLRKRLRDSIWQMIQSLVIVGVAIGVITILLKLEAQSRLILGLAFPSAMALILLRESVARSIMLRSLGSGDAREPIIYVGSRDSMEEFEESMPADVLSEYKVVAQFEPAKGCPNEFAELLKSESVGRVIFAPRHTEFGDSPSWWRSARCRAWRSGSRPTSFARRWRDPTSTAWAASRCWSCAPPRN